MATVKPSQKTSKAENWFSLETLSIWLRNILISCLAYRNIMKIVGLDVFGKKHHNKLSPIITVL